LIRRDRVLKTCSYVASQGRCVGRDGRGAVYFENGTIWLGGHAVTCVEGVRHTPDPEERLVTTPDPLPPMLE
jgi:predicted PhzF superfamily epimerase YddE/YHI9